MKKFKSLVLIVVSLVFIILFTLSIPVLLLLTFIFRKHIVELSEFEILGLNVIKYVYPKISKLLNIECNIKYEVLDVEFYAVYFVSKPEKELIYGDYFIYNEKVDNYIFIDLTKILAASSFIKPIYILMIIYNLLHEMRHCYQHVNGLFNEEKLFTVDKVVNSRLKYYLSYAEMDANSFATVYVFIYMYKIFKYRIFDMCKTFVKVSESGIENIIPIPEV